MNKRSGIFFLALTVALGVHGQVQQGIPARMTAVNGKEFPVFLQRVEGDNIVFQLYKRPNDQRAPMKAITKIEFIDQIDVEGVEQLFSSGDYQGVILKLKSELKPSIDDYWNFMMIENNLQDVFVSLMKAYLRLGDVPSAGKAAEILLKNKDRSIKGQAESITLLSALGEGRTEDAEALLEGIESPAGKLYLGACVDRAKGQYDQAFQSVTDLIRTFGNDLSWMPQAELLSAHLYLDTGLTNSAMQTARQVKNIYKNSDVGNDAARLYSEIQMAVQAHEAAVAAKEAAEEAERAAVRARAAERAKGYGFDVDAESDDEKNKDNGATLDAQETVDGNRPGSG